MDVGIFGARGTQWGDIDRWWFRMFDIPVRSTIIFTQVHFQSTNRYALLATNYLAIFTGLLLFVPSVIILIFARLLQGVSLGLYMAIVPLYIREISPLTYAGTVGVLFQFFMAFGSVFCYLFAFLMGTVLD
jgi:MFS family permease